jgi:hypothetical protein
MAKGFVYGVLGFGVHIKLGCGLYEKLSSKHVGRSWLYQVRIGLEADLEGCQMLSWTCETNFGSRAQIHLGSAAVVTVWNENRPLLSVNTRTSMYDTKRHKTWERT